MPGYAGLDDMIARFGERELIELTDDAGAGAIDATRVTIALENGASVIDGYVAARRPLPLATVPAFLKDIACDLARFHLYRSTPTDGVKDARAAALKMLAQIARGELRLDQGEGEEPARPGAILVNDPGRLFSRQTMDGF